MPEIDCGKERDRLKDVYSLKGDDELLRLRVEYSDLTKLAQDALRDELDRRNLWRDNQPSPLRQRLESKDEMQLSWAFCGEVDCCS